MSSMEDLEAAAHSAQLDFVQKLPDGMDTYVGSGGKLGIAKGRACRLGKAGGYVTFLVRRAKSKCHDMRWASQTPAYPPEFD